MFKIALSMIVCLSYQAYLKKKINSIVSFFLSVIKGYDYYQCKIPGNIFWFVVWSDELEKNAKYKKIPFTFSYKKGTDLSQGCLPSLNP